MKTINFILSKKLLLLSLFMLSLTGYAQNFTVYLANGSNPTPTTFEVDIMLNVNAPTAGVRLTSLTTGVNYNPAILNGGTPCTTAGCGTWTYVSGRSPILGALIATNNTNRATPVGHLRTVGTNLAAASAIDIPPGVYTLGKYRFTNTVAFAEGSNANLWLQPTNTNPTGSTNTIVSFYPFGALTPLAAYTTTSPTGGTGLTLTHTAAAPFSLPLNVPTETCATSGAQTSSVATSCFNTSDGSTTITMSPVPSSTAITYTVDAGGSTSGTLVAGAFTVSGLTSGMHTIVVTGSGGCTTPITVGTTVPAGPDPGTAPTPVNCWDNYQLINCVWVNTGTQAPEPTGLACWQAATFNTVTCVWDVTGTQDPAPTGLACYQTATFNNTTCEWDVTGTQAPAPTGLACYQTATFNNTTCVWDVTGTQAPAPTGLACYQTATFNNTTCVWDVTGTQPEAPTGLACYQTAAFNGTTCVWDVTGTQAPAPTGLACYETATFNNTTCAWDVSGTQPLAPTGLACYQTATFNNTTCVWDVTGTQAPAPTGLACYETATFNNTTCVWDVTGTQPLPPSGATTIQSEGFDDVAGLTGWSVVNTSTPVGTQTWGQGVSSIFSAQSGVADSYAFCNYQSVTGANTISNWFIAPVATLQNGDVIKFWTRTVTTPSFPDRLQVRLSTTGAGTDPVGPTDEGSYTTLLADINPTLTTAGYPTDWTEYTLTVSGLSGPTSSRVAFRYFVEDGGPSGANSDYIGVDTYSITRTGSTLACYESYVFNGVTCQYDITGTQPPAPTGLACYQTATFNGTTCVWDVTGTQEPAPTGLACYQTATFNGTTCVWDVSGTQPMAPTGLACYQTATFNGTTCVWDVTGTQPPAPTVACYETATFNPVTCGYDVTGTPNTLGSVTITAVGSYTWPLPYGTGLTYTTSQIGLTNVNPPTAPCNTATLNLTIVTTVPTVNTFTVGVSCGATISGLNVTINTPVVAGAVTYTFRLTNVATSAVQTVVRPVNSVALSNTYFPGITLGTAYTIQVSVNAGPFGPPCSVLTPAPASTIGANCGTTVASMSTYVYCTAVASVTGYRFRITNGSTSAVQLFDSSLNRFSFSQLPAAFRTFATSYFVEVALRNTDGTYLPFSIGCNVSTPAFPTTSIRPIQCGNYQATSLTESFVAPIVATATKYRFRLSSVVPASSATIDRLLNTFTLSMFPALPAGTACTVEVSLEIGGVFGPYGSACTIITPGLTKATPVVSNEFVAIAFPNPFAEDFMFNVKTSSESTIQIRVYDMLGKQIDNRNVEVSDIENLQVGSNYPSGVYNVIVSQGENTQTVRVIKR